MGYAVVTQSNQLTFGVHSAVPAFDTSKALQISPSRRNATSAYSRREILLKFTKKTIVIKTKEDNRSTNIYDKEHNFKLFIYQCTYTSCLEIYLRQRYYLHGSEMMNHVN